MKTLDDKQVMGERAELLALIYLTRREDLSVIRHPLRGDVDILVSILDNGRDTGHSFGVEVKGVLSERDIRVEDSPRRQEASQGGRPPHGTLPICLFVFVMQGDQGYWKWILEPATREGQGDLISRPEARLRRLDNTEPPKTEELADIIATVTAWHNSRRTLVAA